MLQIIKKYKIALLCISGLLTALTVVFPTIGFLEWMTLTPAAVSLICIADDKKIRLRRVYLYGGAFFMSYYLVIYHWFLYMYPLSFMEVPKGVAILVVTVAWIGLSLIQTLSSSLIFLVFALIFRSLEKLRILAPFFAAALWTVIEWSQTIGWWGVPWGRLCLGQTNTSLTLLSSSIFGSYFVSFLIVAVNFCVAYLFIRQDFTKVLATACICMVVGNLIIGAVVKFSYNNKDNQKIRVAAIQGNIPLNEKWGKNTKQIIKDVHAKYTLEAAEDGADLVILAETVFPYDLNKDMAEYFSNLAQDGDTTVIATCFTLPEKPVYADNGGLRSYNSLFEVKEDGSFGEDVYSKQRLVPFAEFVPLRSMIEIFIPPLAELNMLPTDVLAGEESVVLRTEKGNIGCMICFDSVYENIALESVRDGAQMLIVSTNDAWFKDSAENYMHTSQSKLRAIETGRYVVRAANTGISGIVNPLGEFEEELGILEEGYVIGDIYLRDQTTVYTVIGNLFVYICIGITSALACASLFLYIKNRKAVDNL